jgi:hypothetical protein
MIQRVTLWLLTVAVLLSAVPWELSAQPSPGASLAAAARPVLLADSASPESTGTAVPVDCVCLCASGHSTPARALDVLTTVDSQHKFSTAPLPAPRTGVAGSVFHPPQIS